MALRGAEELSFFFPGNNCFFSSISKGDICNKKSTFFFRNFLKSKWEIEEFMIADAEAVGGRKEFHHHCSQGKAKNE